MLGDLKFEPMISQKIQAISTECSFPGELVSYWVFYKVNHRGTANAIGVPRRPPRSQQNPAVTESEAKHWTVMFSGRRPNSRNKIMQ